MAMSLSASASSDLAVRLRNELRRRVDGEVRFDPGTRATYSTDGSNYRQVPIGVVVPRSIDAAVEAIAVCREFDVPLLSRGGGTSLGGQCCNTAILLDWSKYCHRIVSVDTEAGTALVEPGLVLDDLNDHLADTEWMVGPRPSTHVTCTIGGMIGNNSCGATAQAYGKMVDSVRRLEVLTYDGTRMWVEPTSDDELQRIIDAGGRRGEIYRGLRRIRDEYADDIRAQLPRHPAPGVGLQPRFLAAGEELQRGAALVGSESTLVTVLQAEITLVRQPKAQVLAVLGFDDVVDAGVGRAAGARARSRSAGGSGRPAHLAGALPASGRGRPGRTARGQGLADGAVQRRRRRRGRAPGQGDDRPPGEAHQRADQAAGRSQPSGAGVEGPGGRPGGDRASPGRARHPRRLGGCRGAARSGRRLPARLPGDAGPLRLLGHLGCTGISGRAASTPGSRSTCAPNRASPSYRAFVEEAAHLVTRYGGSLSGEHGDGQARGELLPIMFGERVVNAFEELKDLLDPLNRMNPGKVIRALPLDSNLRWGVDYRPWEPETQFAYPDDDHRFSHAANRCVGVGKCRGDEEGVMCPSYRATKEEEHSTRGRARVLFEMLQGDVITDGWRSEAVRDALDLCLACKGCRSDCPVNVDMATYKAEFLHHHYKRRLRPMAHYSMGWLPLLARLAAVAPGTLNTIAHTPGLSALLKKAGGIDRHRDVPRFAPQRFTSWFAKRPKATAHHGASRGKVVLWPDTFTNNFDTAIPRDAVEVLEAAGFEVEVPQQSVCCGLTWISTGQLDVAKYMLHRTLDVLRPALREGTPVVVLEPSCAAVFRADMPELLHGDEDAKRLAGLTRTLGEVLREKAPEWKPPPVDTSAIVQPHCHQHAILGTADDKQILDSAGVDATILDAGCCGLAGNFGFEAGHYDVSVACAEDKLMPAVRSTDPDTVVLADGFSCRTQISHLEPGRQPLHTAQALAAALHGDKPAEGSDTLPTTRRTGRRVAQLVGVTAVATAAGAALLHRNGHRAGA